MCIDKVDTWSAWQVATKRHHESPLAIRDKSKAKVGRFILIFNYMLHGMNEVTLHRLDRPASMPQAIVCCNMLQCVVV